MGSLVAAEHADDSLFLPFDDDDDALEELVLVDLDSSEDAALAYALESDSGDGSNDSVARSAAEPPAVHSHQPGAHPEAVTGAQPPPAARLLSRKPRGGKKASLKANPNKARDERKGELIYLRKKVSELEAQLGSIRARRPRISTAPAPSSSGDAAPSGHAPLPLTVLNVLEKILNKKTTTKDIDEFVERNQMSAPIADATDADVFNELLQGVEQSYAEIDRVFEANGLAHTETPVSNARVRSDPTTGMFLEIFANQILPFDMHATASAVWHHFTFAKEKTPFRGYSYNSSKFLHASEDTIVENFILKLDAKGTVGNFRVKQILRRHVEAARVVVVWRALIEAFEFSSEPVSGIRFCDGRVPPAGAATVV
ncbi:hypothetical protein PybrP1_003641 [[Pythium] brassicae (nom. inval.)]|nr:hypothetical protein PybrP1_003641 [[Pythium] brassicae (nom. inval.)]